MWDLLTLRNVRTYQKNGEIEIRFEVVRMYTAFFHYYLLQSERISLKRDYLISESDTEKLWSWLMCSAMTLFGRKGGMHNGKYTAVCNSSICKI